MPKKHPQIKKMAFQQTRELPDIASLLTHLSVQKDAKIVFS